MRALKAICVTCLWLFLSLEAVGASTTTEPCRLPHDLQLQIAKKYASFRIVTLSDLGDDDKEMFQKDHPNACPGMAEVDFYGDGKPTFALALLVKRGSTEDANLLVVHQTAEGWNLRSLDSAEASVPVVWSQPPGKYDDIYGNKSIIARHPVIVFCGYNSWAIVYAWKSDHVEKVWLRD